MIKWFSSLLRRIVGRVIDKMKDYFLAWGNIYIPVSLVLFIFAIEKNFDMLFTIMALISVIMGVFAMRVAYKKARDEDNEKERMFTSLLNRIDILINEIRQDRNERNKPKK